MRKAPLAIVAGLLAAVVTWTTHVEVAAQTPDRPLQAVYVVMDVSGSMNDNDDIGRIKINGAKQAITALLDGLYGSNVPVALRSYPAGGGDCNTGELRVDFSRDYGAIGRAARELSADGGTPTAEALEAASRDLRSSGYGRGEIVLVSDGESTCGDPCLAAETIARSGLSVRVNTVGFNISAAGADELSCIAAATGGSYTDVDNADDLAEELQTLTTARLSLDVDAPATVFTSVGRGESPTVEISATVSNTSTNRADRVRLQVTPTGDRRPYVARANRDLGNIEPGERGPPTNAGRLRWSFTPPLDFEDIDLTFTVTATADNAEPVSRNLTVKLRGAIDLGDAGDVLQGRENVVIVGDSYSAGQGAGNYHADTDTRENSCARSDDTYGEDLYPERINLACSGAVTANFWTPQFPGFEDPQLTKLRALDEPPDLVLMTLGGNDVGFAKIIERCTYPGTCHTPESVVEVPCYTLIGRPEVDVTDEVQAEAARKREIADAESIDIFQRRTYGQHHPLDIDLDACFENLGSFADQKRREAAALVPDLVNVYHAIDAVVNKPEWLEARGGEIAPIIVLAYPRPVPEPTRYGEVLELCPKTMDYEEWRWVAGDFVPAVNSAIRQAVGRAEQEGSPVRFVADSEGAFEPSHTICDEDKYINSLNSAAAAVAIPQKLVKAVARFVWGTIGDWTGIDAYEDAANDTLNPTSAERRLAESFHPNALGYRAMTASLVEWSQSRDGQRPITRDRQPLRVEPLPERDGPPIRVVDSVPEDVIRGVVTDFEIPGLVPGAPLRVQTESRLSTVALTRVDDNGVGRFQLSLDVDFEIGAHKLTYTTTDESGQTLTVAVPFQVADPTPGWERWSPLLAMTAGSLALLCGLVVMLTLWRRRRAGRAAAAVRL